MHVEYQKMENVLDIYALFNGLEKDYGLKYSHVFPDPLMAAQAFEVTQSNHAVFRKEEDGRNLQYIAFSLIFSNGDDCDTYIREFALKLGLLSRFSCVYCRKGENLAVVIFNVVDHDGHMFGEFEEKRFMSLFR